MSDVNIQTFSGKVNVSNNFTVGSGHLFVDTQNNKVGLNTTTPEANLHVTGNTYISTDISVGGTLTMGTVTVEALHSLEAVTSVGNTTPHTVEFQNTDTSLVASGNVQANYFIGNGSELSNISLQQVTDAGNTTSNTLLLTNTDTSLVASGNVEVAKDLMVTGNVEVGKDLMVTGNVTMSEDLAISGNVEVGTVSGRVGIGTNAVNAPLHVTNEVEKTYAADHTLNANWANVIQSQYTINTTVSDYSYIGDVKVDFNGNVYITGDYRSDAPVNLGNSITLPASSAIISFFIIKYNPTGVAQWAKTFTSNDGNSTGYGLAIDTNGYIYVTGQTYTTTGINLGGNNITLSGSSTSKMFLIQYNSSGVPQWVKSIDSTSGYNQGKKVATDTNGHVYVTGSYNSNSDITLYTDITLPSSSSDAIFTIKYNSSDGSIDWAKTIITGRYNISGDITTDSGDYIYVTASYKSTSETNLGNGTTLPSTGDANAMCIIKYDPSGTALWANVILNVGNGSSNGNGITSDSMGNIYVTGRYTSTVVINLDNGNTLPIPSSGYDIFVLKYKSDGTTLNATSLGISNGGGNAIVADTHGHVYVSGYNDTTTMYTAKLNTFNLTILNTISFTNYSFGNTIAVDYSGNVYTGGTVNLVYGADIDLGNNVSLTRTLPNSNDTFYKIFGYIIRYDINTTTKNVSTLISDGLEVGAGGLFVDTVRGRVGVATTSPSTTLDVNGTITSRAIGIGTTDPVEKFHLYGSPMIQHQQTYSTGSNDTWYIVGTWEALPLSTDIGSEYGANLLLTFLGGQLYGSNPGGKTEIIARIGNSSSYRSIYWRQNGEMIFSDVRLRRVGNNSHTYDICVKMKHFTNHTMCVECSRTTSFTKKFTSTTEPLKTDTANVTQGTILPSTNSSGSLGIGMIDPITKLHVERKGVGDTISAGNATFSVLENQQPQYGRYGLFVGVRQSNGKPWLQGARTGTMTASGTSTSDTFDILLNPNGSNIVVNGTTYTSDDRIKSNEQYIENATETLLKLKPQTYDKRSMNNIDDWKMRESGLIAQDVWYDTPELRHLVSHDKNANIPVEKPFVDDDPTKDPDYSSWGEIAGLNYEGFIAYLIKSNQELHARIQALENA